MRYVVFNRKGGVGKSTLVVNLAAAAAEAGEKTLIVDLDVQGNATQYLLGPEMGEVEATIGDFFAETLSLRLLKSSPKRYVHETPFENLYLLPADSGLQDLHAKLEARHKIYKLRDLLSSLDSFDTIFIDTPPALSFFTTSALIAAESCLIPFDCDDFSRRAVYQLLGTVREIKEDHNPDLEIGGIVVNFFQAQARLPRQLVEEMKAEGLPVLEPFLMSSVKVKESHQQHKPLLHLLPRHKLSGQIRDLYRTIADGDSGAT